MDPRRAPDRVSELRRAFDSSFADPPPAVDRAREDLLDVRVGSAAYALRVSEVSGLFADTRITPVPTFVPELLGVAGFRGSVLPVYSLAALLGQSVDAGATPRWLVVAAGAQVGLAFDEFRGHVRVRRDAVVPQAHRGAAMPHVRDLVVVGHDARPIVSVTSVLDAIAARARTATRDKE
jgi:chemotaxis signal transduction protein